MAPAKVKSEFISAPIDGLNLITPPTQALPTEALILDNYYIYDWGIRERGPATHVSMPIGADFPSFMFSFSSSTYPNGAWIIAGVNKIYKYDGTTFTQISTDATDEVSGMFCFNKHIFMCDTFTNEIHSYEMGTDTYNDTSFTGGPNSPINGFVFKNRACVLGYQNSAFYYGDVEAVTGAFIGSYDVGQFFQKGSALLWGCSWPYNQGLTNDELLVVGNDAGEIFVYAGDSPIAPNFQLVARAEIPAPLVRSLAAAGVGKHVPVVRVGQDILVGTVRGVISLQKVFAGRTDDTDEQYYAVSRKLGYVIGKSGPDKSSNYPFAYFGAANFKDLYVLNYERGAWSRFPSVIPLSSMTCVSVQASPIDGAGAPGSDSYVLIGDAAGGLWKINEAALVSDPNITYNYSTPFFNFDTSNEKVSIKQRIISRDLNGVSVHNGIGLSMDFGQQTFGTVDNQTQAVSNSDYVLQELSPAGSGRWLQYRWSKVGNASACNEIAGFDAIYEEASEV